MWNPKKLQENEKERRLLRLRLAILVVMVAALLVAGGGCSLTEKLQGLGELPTTNQDLPDLTAGGLSSPPPEVEKTKVTVYFKDQQGRYLVPTSVEVDKAPGVAKEALEALCLGPAQGIGAIASIPEGVQVRSVNLKTNGVCVVDLAGSVAKDRLSPKNEALAVYALVDTLTEFPNVKRVQILVDGQKKDTLAGHIPIDEPMLRNLTFVNDQG
jgi:spore germination protein GerM